MNTYYNPCTRSDCAHNRVIIDSLLKEKKLEQPQIVLTGDAAEVFKLREELASKDALLEEAEEVLEQEKCRICDHDYICMRCALLTKLRARKERT